MTLSLGLRKSWSPTLVQGAVISITGIVAKNGIGDPCSNPE